MSDIGLAGGVGEEQISDSGLSDAQSFTDFSPSGSDGDSYAQASANILAEPIAGRNRSNIVDSVNYDPTFAAAFDIPAPAAIASINSDLFIIYKLKLLLLTNVYS